MSKIKKYLDNKGLATLIEQIKKFGKVKTVDTNEPDEDGDVESIAVLNVDELPAEPKGKVYIYLDNTENENVYSSSFKALTSYTNKEINTPVYIQFNNERLKVYQDYASVNTRGRLTMSVLQRADSDNPGGFYGCYFPTEKGIVAYIPSLNGSYANELIGRAAQFINDTSYTYAGTFTDENGIKYNCLGDYCRAVGIPYTVYGYINSSDALPPTVLQDKSGELHFYKSATATAQVYAKDKQLALYEDLEKAGKVKTVDGKNPDENGDIQLSWVGTKAEWTALDKSQFAGKGIIKVYFTDAETGAVVDTVEAGNMNAVTSNAVANYCEVPNYSRHITSDNKLKAVNSSFTATENGLLYLTVAGDLSSWVDYRVMVNNKFSLLFRAASIDSERAITTFTILLKKGDSVKTMTSTSVYNTSENFVPLH